MISFYYKNGNPTSLMAIILASLMMHLPAIPHERGNGSGQGSPLERVKELLITVLLANGLSALAAKKAYCGISLRQRTLNERARADHGECTPVTAMIKHYSSLTATLLLVALPAFAADNKSASPLTPEIEAKLHSEVVTLVAEAFLTSEGVMKVKEQGWAYVSRSRKEPGCIQYQLQEEATNPGHIFFYEQYASPAAFATHVTSDYSKAWTTMLDTVSTKPIVIHFLNKLEQIIDK